MAEKRALSHFALFQPWFSAGHASLNARCALESIVHISPDDSMLVLSLTSRSLKILNSIEMRSETHKLFQSLRWEAVSQLPTSPFASRSQTCDKILHLSEKPVPWSGKAGWVTFDLPKHQGKELSKMNLKRKARGNQDETIQGYC